MSDITSIKDVFRQTEGMLRGVGIDDAFTEARILLQHVLDVDGAGFLLSLDDSLDPRMKNTIDEVVRRRLRREPLAYIVGHIEFYDIDVIVDSRVLIPRPETEILVETALDWLRERHGNRYIVDVGTGSGCVAVTIARHCPQANIVAIDTSRDALEVAMQNIDHYELGGRIIVRHDDLLRNHELPIDLLVANLPYIPTEDIHGLMPEVRDYEPRSALDGGSGGLHIIQNILLQARDFISSTGALIFEIGFDQAAEAKALALRHFPFAEIRLINDFAGVERILAIYLVDDENP